MEVSIPYMDTKEKFQNSVLCIAPGKYNISYFHDENKNNELDADFMGIPKEGYGFSNNASGKYGPPPIEQRIFIVSENMSMDLVPFY